MTGRVFNGIRLFYTVTLVFPPGIPVFRAVFNGKLGNLAKYFTVYRYKRIPLETPMTGFVFG